jgi:hypothetical protein
VDLSRSQWLQCPELQRELDPAQLDSLTWLGGNPIPAGCSSGKRRLKTRSNK